VHTKYFSSSDCLQQVSHYKRTEITVQASHGMTAVMLSWLENAHSRPLWPAILTHKVGQTDLVFGVRSGFVSRSVRAR